MNTSADAQQDFKGWNLFARVLQTMLEQRGLGLGHLDDRGIGIHPQKVRRLKQSLLSPKRFPVLRPDEIETVIKTFELRGEEQIRLKAALLATAIEEELMDRINHEDALKGAELLLPILEDAIRKDLALRVTLRKDCHQGLGEEEIESVLTEPYAIIDHAILALHLSYSARSHTERFECAHQAATEFASALAQLDSMESTLRESEAWQATYDEAHSGLLITQARLTELEN